MQFGNAAVSQAMSHRISFGLILIVINNESKHLLPDICQGILACLSFFAFEYAWHSHIAAS